MALSRPWAQFKAGSIIWWINRNFDSPQLRRRLETPDQLMADGLLARDSAPRNPQVARAEWEGIKVYIKRYRPSVKNLFRASRARRAFECAFALNAQGIRTPPPIAVGESGSKDAFLITEEVSKAKTFFELRALAGNRAQTRILMRLLARTLARLHDAGFSHSDANFSNWLVSGKELVAIDLDGVRKVRSVSANVAAKDLYRIVRYMSPYERAWFIAQYCRAREHRLDAHKLERLCRSHS